MSNIKRYFKQLVCIGLWVAFPLATAAQITLSMKNKPTREIIHQIEKVSKYRIFYNQNLPGINTPITVEASNSTIEAVMNQITRQIPISYSLKDQFQVIITEQSSKNRSIGQSKKITGVVTDEKGEPVIGANVSVKGTTTGTITDIDGNFTLDASQGETLLVSYIGYSPKEVSVGSQPSYRIAMTEDTQKLDEVVVIGYGTATRKELTGSISSLRMEDSPIANLPNVYALDNLKGNITGLDIGVASDVNKDPEVMIRGQNSIKGNTAPLIVLDGVIYPGSLRDINPNDIASYDVLKDAVSAAVYGSRSANGVIAITTKKGKIGKPIINFNASIAAQTWQRKPAMRNGQNFVDLVNAVNGYPAGTTSWMYPQEVERMNAGQEINWMDEVSRTGMIQNYQVSVSGGAEKMNYYFSASYDDNKGIVVGNNYNRFNLLAKLETSITDWLKVGFDAGYSRRNHSVTGANFGNAISLDPYAPKFRDEKGNLEKYPSTQGAAFVNPLWGVGDGTQEGYDRYNVYDLNAFALFTLPWDRGLTFRTSYRYNLYQRDYAFFQHENFFIQEGPISDPTRYAASTVQKFLAQANGKIETQDNPNYILDFVLNYKKSLGKHNLDVTAVATRDQYKYSWRQMTANDFAANGNTLLGYNGLAKGTIQKNNQDQTLKRDIGYLGRISYNYHNTYFLTGSFRRDGASVFGANRKWGNFAAVGLAWTITNEKFMQSFTPLNYLKIKASWGQNGNQGVNPYQTLAKVTNGAASGMRYEYSNTGSLIHYGLIQNNLGNGILGWEATTKLNIGFESSWLNDRLQVNADFYTSNTTDEIYNQTIPTMTGFTEIIASLGEVSNKGFEVTVNSKNIKTKDWDWSTTVTYWMNRNKLVHLDNRKDADGNELDNITSGMFIGEPLGAIYGYRQNGIIQSWDTDYKSMPGAYTVDGFPKFVDLNKNGEIDPGDREILGYKQPSFNLNMSNTLRYKDIELYVMISGVFGSSKYYQKANEYAYIARKDGGFCTNGPADIDYYTPENQSNKFLSPTFRADGRFKGLQSRTFVRIQNASLSYTFRQEWVKKARLNNFKVFVSANNPLVITGWYGGDPEAGIEGQSSTYPLSSVYSLGVNIGF